MGKYKIVSVDKEHYEEYYWSVDEILEEINRDRSGGWEDYDHSDWKEGWLEFCEGDWYTIPELKEEEEE
jgi:hypothetical protein|tara:strand:+ start:63 stop:269 length:207 start_codon:yes stop_codon:yes gene_type:complete